MCLAFRNAKHTVWHEEFSDHLAPGSITIPSSKRLCPIRLAKSSGVSPRSLATNSLDFWENWPTPNGFNIHGGFSLCWKMGVQFFLLISRCQGIFLEGPSCLFRCMLSESAGKSWNIERLPKAQDQHVSFPTLHVWIIFSLKQPILGGKNNLMVLVHTQKWNCRTPFQVVVSRWKNPSYTSQSWIISTKISSNDSRIEALQKRHHWLWNYFEQPHLESQMLGFLINRGHGSETSQHSQTYKIFHL